MQNTFLVEIGTEELPLNHSEHLPKVFLLILLRNWIMLI